MTSPHPATNPTGHSPGDVSDPFEHYRFGRFPIGKVSPVIEHGAYPAKAVQGESIPISARIFREGHDRVGASVVLTDPSGAEHSLDMAQIWPFGLDIWQVETRFDQSGRWKFRVEAWSDDWHTWQHNAEIKIGAEQDIPLICAEGVELLSEAIQSARAVGAEADSSILEKACQGLDPDLASADLLWVTTDPEVNAAMTRHARRPLRTPTVDYPIQVDRPRALYGSWYEFFPRSQGAHVDPLTGRWVSGTFDQCHEVLEHIAALGFDVAYITPIHPIGSTFRKGPNNSLAANPTDPGSPWAIGSAQGGHDAIHPDLGTVADFDRFVAKAHSLGLEVALDFALQASPDHPWVSEHPEWFTTRLDGTIAYAENPPKKYQDIYPINFDNDPDGIYHEVLRLVRFWIDHGVSIFRVDNPHTKPLNFWHWLISQVHTDHPEVIFFAEAFSRPEIMQCLGKAGFHMSYTYFTWRNTKHELGAYLKELATETAAFMRPNFFVNTPDINPLSVRSGAPAAFAIRMILAAMMSPSWGIYSGFELFEFEPLKAGGEEYLNSEKYEYRPRDLTAEPNLNILMGRLNQIRRDHPALQQLRHSYVLTTTHEDIFAFAKVDGDDRVVVVCSLDPHDPVCGEVQIMMADLGLPEGSLLGVHDELTGADYVWGESNYVALDPASPAHVLSVRAH